jgi:hypothetical protein
MISGLAMKRGPSVDFCGYWPQNRKLSRLHPEELKSKKHTGLSRDWDASEGALMKHNFIVFLIKNLFLFRRRKSKT